MNEQQRTQKKEQNTANQKIALAKLAAHYHTCNAPFYKCSFPKGKGECGEMMKYTQIGRHMMVHWDLYRLQCPYCSHKFCDDLEYHTHQSTCPRSNLSNAIRLPFDKKKEVDCYRSSVLFIKGVFGDQRRIAQERYKKFLKKKAKSHSTPCYDDEEDVEMPPSSQSVATSGLVGLENTYTSSHELRTSAGKEAPQPAQATEVPTEFAPNQPSPHPDMLNPNSAPRQESYWNATQYKDYHQQQHTVNSGPIREHGSNRPNIRFDPRAAPENQTRGFQQNQQAPNYSVHPPTAAQGVHVQTQHVPNNQGFLHQQSQPAPPFPWNRSVPPLNQWNQPPPQHAPFNLPCQSNRWSRPNAMHEENPPVPGLATIQLTISQPSYQPSHPNPLVPPIQTESSALVDPRLQRTKPNQEGPQDSRAGISAAPILDRRHSQQGSSDDHRDRRNSYQSPPPPQAPREQFGSSSCRSSQQDPAFTHAFMNMSTPEPVEEVRKQFAPRRSSTTSSFSNAAATRAANESTNNSSSRTPYESSATRSSRDSGESSRGPVSGTRSRTPSGESTNMPRTNGAPIPIGSSVPLGAPVITPSTSRAHRLGTPVTTEEPSTSRPRPQENASTPIRSVEPSTSRSRESRTPIAAPTRPSQTPVHEPTTSTRQGRSVSRAPTERTGVVSLHPQIPKKRRATPTRVHYSHNRHRSPMSDYGPDANLDRFSTATTKGAPSQTSRSAALLHPPVGSKPEKKDERRSQAQIQADRARKIQKNPCNQSTAQPSAQGETSERRKRSEDRERSRSRSRSRSSQRKDDPRNGYRHHEKRRK